MEQRIEIRLDEDKILFAERGGDPDFKEIFIGIEDLKGNYLQLAVVGEDYDLDEGEIIPIHDQYSIKVFSPDGDIKETVTFGGYNEWYDDYYDSYDLEMGFDPYLGCYTDDC